MIGTKNAAFFISMCDDVLVEVLSSGNRKQLFTLTKNGKRFGRLIEHFFGRAPFLLMDIILDEYRFNLHTYYHTILTYSSIFISSRQITKLTFFLLYLLD